MRLLLSALVLWLALPLCSQRVDPNRNSHHRAILVDRLITDDQGVRRPMHATRNTMGCVVLAFHPVLPLVLLELVFAKDSDMDTLREDAARDPVIRVWKKATTKRQVMQTSALAAGFTPADLDKAFSKAFVRVP